MRCCTRLLQWSMVRRRALLHCCPVAIRRLAGRLCRLSRTATPVSAGIGVGYCNVQDWDSRVGGRGRGGAGGVADGCRHSKINRKLAQASCLDAAVVLCGGPACVLLCRDVDAAMHVYRCALHGRRRNGCGRGCRVHKGGGQCTAGACRAAAAGAAVRNGSMRRGGRKDVRSDHSSRSSARSSRSGRAPPAQTAGAQGRWPGGGCEVRRRHVTAE